MQPLDIILALLSMAFLWFVFKLAKNFAREVEEEKIRNRESGCRCPVDWLGIYSISPECPVHKELCTIKTFKNWYGKEHFTIPFTTVERTRVCHSCFERLAEHDVEMFYLVEMGRCGVCGAPKEMCVRVPTNLVEDWVSGETFHFHWNKEMRKRSATRRVEDHDSHTSPTDEPKHLCRPPGDQECMGIRGLREGGRGPEGEEIHQADRRHGPDDQSGQGGLEGGVI